MCVCVCHVPNFDNFFSIQAVLCASHYYFLSLLSLSLLSLLPLRNNTERLICIGLDLVTVMLECGGSSLGDIKSLRPLIQDGLCHHLLMVRH